MTTQAEPPTSSEGDRSLVEIALPLIQRTAHRVELAGHRVIIDDRSGRTPASIRLQIRPWVGPFGDMRQRPHPVLEVVTGPGSDGLLARWWPDPADDEPAEIRTIPLEVAGRRLSRTLLDFVEDVLSA